MEKEFEIELEEADEATIALKDELLEVLEGNKTRECLLALTCGIVEIIISTAPSEARAIEAVAAITASMVTSISGLSEAEMCNWNQGTVQ